MTFPPIEQACYWLARRRPRTVEPLEGTVVADVVVVGAGLTGLWSALFLKALDPAAEVVILEQEIAAYGASGRNAGMLAETVDHSHGLAIQHFGEDEARTLARLGEANVAEMTAFLAERKIHCDYEPTGRLIAALTEAQLAESHRSVEVARALGVHTYRSLNREEFRAQIDSPLYLGGVQVTGGGILDPVMLVDGLRAEAERHGVRVHEQSRVEAVRRHGAGVEVRTTRGRVTARRAVLATNAYTHRLRPSLSHRFIPLYDYILVSDPLSSAQREAIRWHGRQGVTDGRSFFNYYRLTADNRILWGTSEAAYWGRNRVDSACDHSPAHYAALRSEFSSPLPGARAAGVPLRLGRADLFDHAADALLRAGHGWPSALWTRVHRSRTGQHEAGRSHPGAHGARSPRRAARVGPGAAPAIPLPARAHSVLVRRPGHARAPTCRRGGSAEPPAPLAGPDGNRVFELKVSGRPC